MIPLLILHGWGSSAKNWAQVKKVLEEQGYKVFLPDLPGFGENLLLKKAWSIDDYVEWLREFCEKNNISQVFLLGHSFGGAVAAKYSFKYPENVEKLFLIASSGIRKKTFKKELLKKISPFFRRFSLIKKIFYRFFIKSDYQQTSGLLRETYLKVINEDISAVFSQIKIPVIIIWGEKDEITPLSDAFFINQEIKNSKLEVLPGIGHRIREQAFETLISKIINHIK
jgi:pimeloyl-ACP methyl ester carboxylesterase